jgi:hypothetical protein
MDNVVSSRVTMKSFHDWVPVTKLDPVTINLPGRTFRRQTFFDALPWRSPHWPVGRLRLAVVWIVDRDDSDVWQILTPAMEGLTGVVWAHPKQIVELTITKSVRRKERPRLALTIVPCDAAR